MENYIELKDIRIYAHHGVMEQERIVGNEFVINALLTVSLEAAMESDNLNDTINYAQVYTVIASEMKIASNLLEHVAGRILKSLQRNFPQLIAAELKITKLNPPIQGEVHSASVIVRQTY